MWDFMLPAGVFAEEICGHVTEATSDNTDLIAP
jgi:hypothetical protein